MRIHSGLNLPAELISAQHVGKLVIFAGAGVSIDPPSSYPNFKELALEVNETAGNILPTDKIEPIEGFLGKLDKCGINVHSLVKQMLSRETSKPNQIHKDIIGLFDNPNNIRIVTTNFDSHFSTVLSSSRLEVPEYRAPALPLGGSFSGLVYLHGNVDQHENQLVITDEDFGKAYLVDSWATRFLGSLFTEYTVLFIGYSHSDEIMKYLSRGLPPNSSRYALTKHGEEDNWQYFNITPVGFKKGPSADKFRAFREGIKNWAKLTRMDAIDHGKKIKTIAKKRPEKLNDVEEDYIVYCLSRIETTRIFTHYVKNVEWFSWLYSKEIIHSLFTPYSTATDIQKLLASWICENFLFKDSELILEVIEKKGQKINVTLWETIAYRLAYGPRISPSTRGLWVALLLNNLPPNDHAGDLLSQVLANCKFPEDRDVIMVLFEYLISPHQHLQKYFNVASDKSAPKVLVDVTIPGELYHLGEAWKNLIEPNIKDFAIYLENVVSVNLMRAHYILKASGKANSLWDSQSFRRSSIEPHEQDKYESEFDILINTARRVMEYFAEEDEQTCQNLIEKWFNSDVPLLKRIAIHGVIKSSFHSPETKIAWLLKHKMFFELSLRREVFLLLQVNYGSVSETLRKQVLKVIADWAKVTLRRKKDRERLAYDVFSMLEWLHRNAPGCKLTEERFVAHSKKWPIFKPRPNPEFVRWSTTGFVKFESPVLADNLIKAPPKENLELLLNYRADGDAMYRNGMLQELSMAVSSSFPWSIELFQLLEGQINMPQDLWQSIFQSWEKSDLTFSQMNTIIPMLLQSPALGSVTKEICHFLAFKIANAEPDRPINLWDSADKLATLVWEKIAGNMVDLKVDNDPFQNAFFSEGGLLAEFWVRYLQRLQEETPMFPTKIKQKLETLITGVGNKADAAKIILLSHTSYLSGLDSIWVKEKLLPLLDYTDPRELMYWAGFLQSNLSNEFVDDIVHYYRKLFNKDDAFVGNLLRELTNQIATICIYHKGFNPLYDGWLIHFLKFAPIEGRCEWATWVRRYLVDLTESDREVLWKTWIKDYLVLRLNGIPNQIDNRELIEILGWALSFKSIFQEVLLTINRFKAPDLTGSSFFYWLKKSQLSDRPEELIDLLLYLFEASRHDTFFGQQLYIIAQQINGKIHSKTKLRRFNNTLVRHGVYEVLGQ